MENTTVNYTSTNTDYAEFRMRMEENNNTPEPKPRPKDKGEQLADILSMQAPYLKVRIVQPFHDIGDGLYEAIISNAVRPYGHLYRVLDAMWSPFVLSTRDGLLIWGDQKLQLKQEDEVYAKIAVIGYDENQLQFQFMNTGILMNLPMRMWDTVVELSKTTNYE